MYAQLGTIRFEQLKGFTSLEETFGVNYAQHERINGKPRLEAVGDILDTISFSMLLHSDFTDPEVDIQRLKQSLADREVMTLILGNGSIVGDFVIPSFTKSVSFTDPKGNIISCTLEIELLEAFDDSKVTKEKQEALAKAFATQQRNANVRAVIPPKPAPSTVLVGGIAKIESSGKIIQQHTASIENNTNSLDYYSNKIQGELDKMTQYSNEVQQQLSNTQHYIDIAQSLPSTMQSIDTAIQNMVAIFPISDVNDLKNLTSQLNAQVLNAKSASVNISNESILRKL